MAKKKTDSKKNDLIPKKGGSPSREVSYQYASQYTQEAFDRAVSLMRNSNNESIVLGAVKTILDKTLPDRKAMELTGENQGPLQIKIVEEKFRLMEDAVDINE